MRKFLAFWAWTATLLLLEVHLKWLMIRTQLLADPAGLVLNLVISYLASIMNDKLSQRIGVVIPFEHTFCLARSFDEEIITSHPELARSLGTPKCDPRLVKKDAEGRCAPLSAYRCYNYHSTRRADGRGADFDGMAACYAEFRVSAAAAHSHSKGCHGEMVTNGWSDCMLAADSKFGRAEQCKNLGMVIGRCASDTGHWQMVMELLEKGRELLNEKGTQPQV